MGRSLIFVDLIKKIFPWRFQLARATKLPVVGSLVDAGFFGRDEILYLPKDKTIAINGRIERPEEIVLPSQVVDYFIKQANHHWIMDFCLCRTGNNCQDYGIEFGCIFLGAAVSGINPQYGRRVSREEALTHAQRSREAGLVQMIGRSKADTIWLGAGPGHKLLTICNCCPCCCLWNLIPQLNPSIGRKVSIMPGIQVEVTDQCGGCGLCMEDICFTNAIQLVNGLAVIDEACRGCGRCVEICPSGAIELTIMETAFVQNAINEISPLVDLS